jgi:hypothetical protein
VVRALRERVVPGGLQRPRPRVVLAAQLLGVVLILLAVAGCVRAWMRGMGSLATVPQEHDTIIHVVLTAYIRNTGIGAPWLVLPADLVNGARIQPYPDGMHALAAMIGPTPVEGFNAITVVFTAIVWPLSAATLAYYTAGRARLGRWCWMPAAGVAALIAAGLYRPMFMLSHVGGILPNAATLAMAAGLVAAILAIPQPSWRYGVPLGLGCAGAVAVHPSVAMTVGLTVIAWWAGELFVRGGIHHVRRHVIAALPVAAVAGIAVVPMLAQMARAGVRAVGWSPDISPQSLQSAVGRTFGVVYDGYMADVPSDSGQTVVMVFMLVGVAAILLARRPLGLLTAWTAWAVVTIGMYLRPGSGVIAVVTAFFYNSAFRILAQLNLLVPQLGAFGLLLPVVAAAGRLRRWLPTSARWLALGGVTAIALVFLAGPLRNYLRLDESTVASRYSRPDFVRVSGDDMAAINWLAPRVRPGERVLNSANDGSTYLYVYHGVPVVNTAALGVADWPPTYQLLASFNQYPHQSGVRRMLTDLNVHWLYVDSSAPTIGAGGSPERWTGGGSYSTAAGLRNLDGLPATRLAFRSGTVSVYWLDLDAIRNLPANP